MGSLLFPILANIVLENLEEQALQRDFRYSYRFIVNMDDILLAASYEVK